MKKKAILALAMILLFSLTLTACTESNPGETNPEPPPIETEPCDEKMQGEDFALTIDEEMWHEGFSLTISAEETTLPQGENFRVDVELKNNSGECHEIVYSILFWPSIPGWRPFGGIAIDPPEPRTRFFETDSVIRNVGLWGDEGEPWLIGDDLEPGTHELTFRAAFYLISVEDDGELTEQQIRVVSDTILLTVQ